MDLKEKIDTIPNWPIKGIMFRDITTLLKDPEGFREMNRLFYERYKDTDIVAVVGVEARGFIMGAVLADKMGVSFIPIRKKGKLPPEVVTEEYQKEYGPDIIEIKKNAINPGSKVLLIDDLLATGGTVIAAGNLLKKVGAEIVECAFVVDLPDIGGKKVLEEAGYKVFTMVEFEGE
ncbi:adenine phosphoribosyltransferase [archaeon]|nr:adenine phosphoribosyltransferase [archaeon]MBL7057321.1 adenine phosphoribosyltransferase [Candidatus Woesearchaeota archaeon]